MVQGKRCQTFIIVLSNILHYSLLKQKKKVKRLELFLKMAINPCCVKTPLCQYGFHVKKFCNIWNYHIPIKKDQSINETVHTPNLKHTPQLMYCVADSGFQLTSPMQNRRRVLVVPGSHCLTLNEAGLILHSKCLCLIQGHMDMEKAFFFIAVDYYVTVDKLHLQF